LEELDEESEQKVFELDEQMKRLVPKQVKIKEIIKMIKSCDLSDGSFVA